MVKKTGLALFLLLLLSSCSPKNFFYAGVPGHDLSADENYKQRSLVIQKLHLMQQANLELNALEAEGMPKSDIYRIKRAMDRKIKLLTEEALYLIEVL